METTYTPDTTTTTTTTNFNNTNTITTTPSTITTTSTTTSTSTSTTTSTTDNRLLLLYTIIHTVFAIEHIYDIIAFIITLKVAIFILLQEFSLLMIT